MLPKLPDILNDAEDTMMTNFPPDRLSEMLDVAQQVDDKNITRKVLDSITTRRAAQHDRRDLPAQARHERSWPSSRSTCSASDSRYDVPPPASGASPSTPPPRSGVVSDPAPASTAGIVRTMILRSSHSDQRSM